MDICRAFVLVILFSCNLAHAKKKRRRKESAPISTYTPLTLQVGVGNQGSQSALKLKLPPESKGVSITSWQPSATCRCGDGACGGGRGTTRGGCRPSSHRKGGRHRPTLGLSHGLRGDGAELTAAWQHAGRPPPRLRTLHRAPLRGGDASGAIAPAPGARCYSASQSLVVHDHSVTSAPWYVLLR